MAPDPLISVIVPVYNVEGYVSACLKSIMAQSLGDFEVIVIDDGSTDDSLKIARETAGHDKRFQFIQRANGGLSVARNTGLSHARGTFISFVDSDDKVHETFLERLHSALAHSDSDWIACGLEYEHPDGRKERHPAIHNHAAPLERSIRPTKPKRFELGDWRNAVQHFPSAWNKLYHRNLIGNLRFTPGQNFEDHAFFCTLVDRTDHILHLNEALYIQSMGRDGQITRDASPRIHDQFAALRDVEAIIKRSDKPGGIEAFRKITTRTLFERSQVFSNETDRQTFVQTCRAFASEKIGIENLDCSLNLPAAWRTTMEGQPPVSVVIPTDGNLIALRETLWSLSEQTLSDFEVLIAPDQATCPDLDMDELKAILPSRAMRIVTSETGGPSAARNTGLGQASGELIMFLDAGDLLHPKGLSTWHQWMSDCQADLGFSGFYQGKRGQALHYGLHDRKAVEGRFWAGILPVTDADALLVHPHPSAKIFRTQFLKRAALSFPPEPLGSWFLTIASLRVADKIVYIDRHRPVISMAPNCRKLWADPCSAHSLATAIDDMTQKLPQGLSAAQRRRLLVRAFWEKNNFASYSTPGLSQFQQTAGQLFAQVPNVAPDQLDPYVDDATRLLLGLEPVPTIPERESQMAHSSRDLALYAIRRAYRPERER